MISLDANIRNTKTKGELSMLRNNGGVPAIIYGGETPNETVSISKKLLKTKGEVRLSISDMLNQTQYFYQNTVGGKSKLEKDQDAYRFTRRFGTTFSLTFNYSL